MHIVLPSITCPVPTTDVIIHYEPFVDSFSPFLPLDVTYNVAGMHAGRVRTSIMSTTTH